MPVPTTVSVSAPPLSPLPPVLTSFLACRFTSWYPHFKKISPKATIVNVSDVQPDFFEWLEEDGLILPRGSGVGVIGGSASDSDGEEEEEEEEEDDDDDDDDQDDQDDASSSASSSSSNPSSRLRSRDFTPLDTAIRRVIDKYDGSVFPKLDWSAPRDAAWILPGQTLKCATPADVYLVLKSSDFVGKDLSQAEEINRVLAEDATTTSSDPTSRAAPKPLSLNLILKSHFTFLPAHEFRCFVRANHLIALTQRDGTPYDFLQPKEVQLEIRRKVEAFWWDHLRSSPLSGRKAAAAVGAETDGESEGLQDYIFDVYFTRDRSRVFLVDVNPYLPRTDALLWDWDELETLATRQWERAWRSSRGLPLRGEVDRSTTTATSSSSSSSEEEDSEEDEDEDLGEEQFLRIYLDGRPPTTHTLPPSTTNGTNGNGIGNGNGQTQGTTRRRPYRPLPKLRLLPTTTTTATPTTDEGGSRRDRRGGSGGGSGGPLPLFPSLTSQNRVPVDLFQQQQQQ